MKDERLIRTIVHAMFRGYIVLDENLYSLAEELRKLNIIIITPEAGTKDDEIKKSILPGRIFITNNTKDFLDDAPNYEYGIISTEKIKSKDQEKLSKMISKAIISNSLWSKKHGFLLELREDGKHKYQDLIG